MQNYKWKEMTMGTCYYPEHWDKSLWQEDLQRMKEVGITCIRIAEFAWTIFEPVEGEFSFDFFDSFMEVAEKEGMSVIIGTPTATPPVWLTEKYPEVLNCDIHGIPYRHGARRHYNYNAPIYQELTKRLVEQMASHYGKHPNVVGWQIDNELNCETDVFYSEADSAAFRQWAKEKYGTLEALNKHWGTVFWNETVTDWNQIYVPRSVINNGVNPHMLLDYYRFVSDSCRNFCKMQADIIRKYKKEDDFITTNGMFWNQDNHKMTEESLDVYTYDSYPNFAHELDIPKRPNLLDRHWSKNLIEVRSVCPHFGIMEQQSGGGGWVTRMDMPMPKPGQLTLWAMQSVAHGADYMSFFRWRTCSFGTEIYWHGILGYDNRDNRRLAEVRDFYKKFKALDGVCQSAYKTSFALLRDYDNMWDMNKDNWHRRVQSASEEEIFVGSQLAHMPYDSVFLFDDTDVSELAKYPVIIYPHPSIMDEARAEVLKAYVAQGGTLIIGCRAGYKDMNGQCPMMPMPGLLQELTGTDIADFTLVPQTDEKAPVAIWENSTKMDMPVFNDVITAHEGTKVLATYENTFYAGEAALTEHAYGKGRVLHLGATFTRDSVRTILQYVGAVNPFEEFIDAPESVELALREKGGKRYVFALNYPAKEAVITLKTQAKRVFTGEMVSGEFVIPAYGVEVFEIL